LTQQTDAEPKLKNAVTEQLTQLSPHHVAKTKGF